MPGVMSFTRPLVLSLSIVLLSGSALASGEVTKKTAIWDAENTLFRGYEYRYEQMGLLSRTLRTIVAMPNSIRYFDKEDYLISATVGLPVLALMLPLDNPYDLTFQRFVQRNQTSTLDKIFPHLYTIDFAIGTAGVAALTYGLGYAIDNEPLIEYGSLFLEGLAAAQIIHSVIKIAIGREGPDTETGRGKIYGPTRFFYPAGTPSGHILTYYYTSFLAARYLDSIWLEVLAHIGGLYFATSLIYNDQHFISDVIWGAPIGYFAARWMMRHRSSKYSYKGADKAKNALYFGPRMNPLYGGLEYGFTYHF